MKLSQSKIGRQSFYSPIYIYAIYNDISTCVCLPAYYCKFGKKHNNSCISGKQGFKADVISYESTCPHKVWIQFTGAIITTPTHIGLEKFCGMMNMPTPMAVKNYNAISKNLTNAAKDVALKLMKDATNEAKMYKGCVGDIGVSVDDSGQKRGYISLNGVITAISIDNGKIVDLEVLNRYCKQCDTQHRLLKVNLESLNTWKESYKNICKLRHEGTALAMEAAGAQRIFKHSIEERGAHYYGDGNSTAYSSVRLIYPGIMVKEFECIGHYQNRLGTRLLKLKKINKGLSELTKPIIDKLQNYFVIAIHDNLSSVEEIRKDIYGQVFCT